MTSASTSFDAYSLAETRNCFSLFSLTLACDKSHNDVILYLRSEMSRMSYHGDNVMKGYPEKRSAMEKETAQGV